MTDETTMIAKPVESQSTETTVTTKPSTQLNESNFRGLSIRAILALLITVTGCANVLVSIWKPGAALSSDFLMLWSVVIGCYFTQKNTSPAPAQTTTTTTKT